MNRLGDRALGGALLAGGLAALYFGTRPPMPVRVGLHPIDAYTPAHYQVSAFPAWGAFVAMLASDRKDRVARIALLGATGALATARLAGRSSLSGHAVFLAALMAFEVTAPRRTPFALPLALGGYAVTAFYKSRWRDTGGLVRSSAVGAAIGIATRLWSKHGRYP